MGQEATGAGFYLNSAEIGHRDINGEEGEKPLTIQKSGVYATGTILLICLQLNEDYQISYSQSCYFDLQFPMVDQSLGSSRVLRLGTLGLYPGAGIEKRAYFRAQEISRKYILNHH